MVCHFIVSMQNVSPAARKLAISVVQHCAEKLEPFVQRFLTSFMLRTRLLEVICKKIIIRLFLKCTPQMLLAVIPNLTQELLTDQVDVRLKVGCLHYLGNMLHMNIINYSLSS